MKIPEDIKNRFDYQVRDYGSYQVDFKIDTEAYTNHACYALALNEDYRGSRFECLHKVGSLPAEIFAWWFENWKKIGLVPDAVVVDPEKRNITIPAYPYDYHSLHVTMCVFRDADISSRDVAKIYYTQQEKEVSFLQAFQYIFQETQRDGWHTFVDCKRNLNNPLVSQAILRIGDMTIKERNNIGERYTYKWLTKIARNITKTKKEKQTSAMKNYYGVSTAPDQGYDLLNPALTPIFTTVLTDKECKVILKEAVKNGL